MTKHKIVIDEDFKYQATSYLNLKDGSVDFHVNDYDDLRLNLLIRPDGSSVFKFGQDYEVGSAEEAKAFITLIPKLYGLAEQALLDSDTPFFPLWNEGDFER